MTTRAIATVARSLGYEVLDASSQLAKINRYLDLDLHVGYRVHAHLDFLSRRYPSILIAEDVRGEGQQTSLRDPHVLTSATPDLRKRVRVALESEVADGFPTARAGIDVIEETWPVMSDFLSELRQQLG